MESKSGQAKRAGSRDELLRVWLPVAEEVSVPLSCRDEFYDLRVHDGLIQQKPKELKAAET